MKHRNLPTEVRSSMVQMGVELVHGIVARVDNKGHQVYLSELRRGVISRAEKEFLNECETRREREALAKSIGDFARRRRSAGLVWQVQRRLRDDDKIAIRLLSERYDDAEKHWNDLRWMKQHRMEFLPTTTAPATMLVAIDFDESAASAISERDGMVAAGVLVTSSVAATNALDIDALSDEAAAELGTACGEASLLAVKLENRPAFQVAYLRVVGE